ncbi:MAG: C4-dicarboxylate-binding protein DctP [Paracoccaceae bacterium]|jgi:C4-dicarboxylate-binding protein DctP
MKSSLNLTAAVALALTSFGPVSASAETIMKFHHNLPEGSATDLGARKFEELVEARTNGEIDVQIFPNNALGDDVEAAQQMQFGAIHAAPIPTAKLSNFNPSLQLIDLPFLFPSQAVTYAVLDSEAVGGTLLDALAASGFTGGAFWEAGFKQLTCNKLIEKPSDYEGQKVRVMESPLLIAQFEMLGASAIPIAFSEVYTALQQGVVDCQENPIVSINAMKFYEVQDYMMLSNHGYLGAALIFSKVWFDSQPAAHQQILLDAALEAGAYQRQVSGEMTATLLEGIVSAGTTTVVEMTPTQIDEFSVAMRPVHDMFSDKIGTDLMAATYAEIEKQTALLK